VKIEVTGTSRLVTAALRDEVRRRVLLAMARFGPEVHGVRASLAQPSNPLGGVDQRCRAQARLRSGLVLRAEAINGRIELAVARSMAHLALLVADAVAGDGGGGPPAPRR
jgi:hypothetical protein